MKCDCRQVWDVYEVEDREEGDARFTLYATVEIDGDARERQQPFPVHAGESFYEGDRCPTCGESLEEVLRYFSDLLV